MRNKAGFAQVYRSAVNLSRVMLELQTINQKGYKLPKFQRLK